MKISIDKNFVTLAALPKVKADIKEFKARYTDNDLLSRFVDETGYTLPYNGEIMKASAEAFTGASVLCDETQFSVEIVVYCLCGVFAVCRFYCDMDLTIDLTEPLYSCNIYTRAD